MVGKTENIAKRIWHLENTNRQPQAPGGELEMLTQKSQQMSLKKACLSQLREQVGETFRAEGQ